MSVLAFIDMTQIQNVVLVHIHHPNFFFWVFGIQATLRKYENYFTTSTQFPYLLFFCFI